MLAGPLRLSLRALRKFPGRLLKGGKRHPVPLGEKAQVGIAAKWSLMAKLAQEVADAVMILKIPGGKSSGNRWIWRASAWRCLTPTRRLSSRLS